MKISSKGDKNCPPRWILVKQFYTFDFEGVPWYIQRPDDRWIVDRNDDDIVDDSIDDIEDDNIDDIEDDNIDDITSTDDISVT